MNVELVILNYNGEGVIEPCLPSIVDAASHSKYQPRIIFLDNCSTDLSVQYVARNFPSIQIVRSKQNRVLCSYNDYLARCSADVTVLLNNDMKVKRDFIDPLIDPFEHEQYLFMVTSKCLSFDGSRYEGGRTRFRMKYGVFWASGRYKGHENLIDRPGNTMAAGYGAFSREKFLALGGYDDLYLPGRLEDSDLCFRAWKRGWHCLYEPRSVVYHDGGISFRKAFGTNGTLIINHRNSFLFLWKNISDPLLILEHIFWLPFRLLFALFRGQTEFVLGFFQALGRLGRSLGKRTSQGQTRTDRQVFNQV